jgi:3-oxoacyl-[acyl-carrier protein] reductase
MNERGFGRVINIGSNSGKMGGTSNVVAYAASKAALHNLARSIASEQARHGVTANAIAACLIDTEMAHSADLDELGRSSPMGRLGSPEDIAYAVLFLAAPEAAYITGEVMDVNGGYYID